MVKNLLNRVADFILGELPPATQPSAQSSGPSESAKQAPATASASANEDKSLELAVVRHITFWRTGFQIEAGDLRPYADPEQARILQQINDGNAPTSVLNVRPGQLVELVVSKRIDEDYIPSTSLKTEKS